MISLLVNLKCPWTRQCVCVCVCVNLQTPGWEFDLQFSLKCCSTNMQLWVKVLSQDNDRSNRQFYLTLENILTPIQVPLMVGNSHWELNLRKKRNQKGNHLEIQLCRRTITKTTQMPSHIYSINPLKRSSSHMDGSKMMEGWFQERRETGLSFGSQRSICPRPLSASPHPPCVEYEELTGYQLIFFI